MPESSAPKPVKSAKDVINAIYANRGAAQPVQAKNPIHAPRPAATSSVKATPRVKVAKSTTQPTTVKSSIAAEKPVVQPEVKTSLKLSPKKPTIVRPPRPATTGQRKSMDLRPAKGNTQLAISAIKKAASDVTGQAKPKSAAKPAVITAKKPTARPSTTGKTTATGTKPPVPRPAGPRRMDDIRRPAPVNIPSPAPSAPAETLQTVAERLNRSEKRARLRPLDSIKNRFRPAPKGYSAREADQIRKVKPEGYHNPDFTPEPEPTKPAVHLYGMTEGPDTFASAPDLIEPDQTVTDSTGLGVIEDYHSTDLLDLPVPEESPEAKPSKKSKKSAPDNNRYALGGQSPFLRSVNVEKRPLSDDPVMRHPSSENPVYGGQDLAGKSSGKNIYPKKSKKFSKTVQPSKPSDSALSSRPTVIVPARRRSHAPLFILLIVTVILGAVVGAAVYLFLFQ